MLLGATNEIFEISETDISKPGQIKPLDTTKRILENVSWDWLQPMWVKLKANGGKKMFLALWWELTLKVILQFLEPALCCCPSL